MGSNSTHEGTSVSRPNYGADTGYESGTRQPTQSDILFQNERNKKLADAANEDFRHENPLLAMADDSIQLVKQVVCLGLVVSVSYLGLQAYSTFKEK